MGIPRLEVVQVLEDVDMQDQRLAAAGRVPEGELVQVVGGVVLELLSFGVSSILGHLGVQAVEQALPTVEIPVEVDLGEQQRQVLEIFHRQQFARRGIAAMGDLLPLRYDVQVIAAQLGFGDPVHVEQVARQLVEELRLAVIVDALVPVIAKPRLQSHQAAAMEMAQHPAVQHQLLMERPLLLRGPRHQSANPSSCPTQRSKPGQAARIFGTPIRCAIRAPCSTLP